MNDFEIGILNFIQDKLSCKFLDTIMPIITKLGDGGVFWIAIAVIFIILKKTRKTGFSMGLALLLGLIIGNLILKNAFARIRPYDVNTNVTILIKHLSDYSFPSGHTLASFEAATVLMIRDKKFGIPALIIAILIAFSRIYLYVHYPSDVIASILIGIVIAIISCKIIDYLYKKYESKKKL